MQNETKIKNSQRSHDLCGPGYLYLTTQRCDFCACASSLACVVFVTLRALLTILGYLSCGVQIL